jgi:triosephosphate isomerase
MLCREARQFVSRFSELGAAAEEAEIGIAPPFTAIAATHEALKAAPKILLGAQNVHWLANGAHTGEISAPMLCEQGVQFSVLGHSERRHIYGETSEQIAKRARAAIDHSLRACVCVGEMKEQFERGETREVVTGQLRESLSLPQPKDLPQLVICYEPVWAIGTGLTPTVEQINLIHTGVRKVLVELFGPAGGGQIRILYGGSVSPSNIAEITAIKEVHGAIVGGASLEAEKFALIVKNGVMGKKAVNS